uniref:Uncharacterized protein n=1 Tax=Oryza nivara TaxID=4536 RepID=A0A0E0G7V9_ORYNI
MVKSLVGSRRMTQKNHHGNKCAEKDDQSFGMREEKAEDGRESADYKQKRVMDINRVTDKNCKSRKKDLESEYRFDCEDEEVTFNVYNIDMEILELIITHSDLVELKALPLIKVKNENMALQRCFLALALGDLGGAKQTAQEQATITI